MAAVKPLLDEALIAKIKGVQIRARYLVNDVFSGQYESAFKGRGMEFDEVREYQPGDDIRHIDWNVTARMDRPFVKRHREERELTVIFMVDVSGSSDFGSKGKFKNEVAAEIAALLAYTALRNNDKVGLLIFSDHVEHFLPPKKGRGHVWQVIRDILSYRAKAVRTDLNVPLEYLNRIVKKRSVVFLLSDFQAVDLTRELRIAASRHEVVAISILDPRERELPKIGYLTLEDAETGETLCLDTRKASASGEFKRLVEKQIEAQKEFFAASKIDFIRIGTEESHLDPILRYFRQRERR